MFADRVVSHCKSALKGNDFFTPHQMIDSINGVSKIRAAFLEHASEQLLSWNGWKSVLWKWLKPLPAGCTIDNYLFEFYPNGKLCIRKDILAPP